MNERSEPGVRNHGYRCAIRTTARLRAVTIVLEELQSGGRSPAPLSPEGTA